MDVIDLVDFPVIDKINAIGGAFIVLATYIFGEHWVLFAAFLLLNFLDYITGTMKGRILKIESSSAGLKGIIKKFSYWIMIVIAFGMSPVLNEIGETINVDFSRLSPCFGWFMLASLSVNELRSVIENLVESGVDVPPILITGLKVAQKVIAAQEKLFDGDVEIDTDSGEKVCHVDITTPPDELEGKDTVTLKIHTIHHDEE